MRPMRLCDRELHPGPRLRILLEVVFLPTSRLKGLGHLANQVRHKVLQEVGLWREFRRTGLPTVQ